MEIPYKLQVPLSIALWIILIPAAIVMEIRRERRGLNGSQRRGPGR